MPRITFTPHLKRHVDCPNEAVAGATVREALDAYFVTWPKVRNYIFDEQGALRRHVIVFIDSEQLKDRDTQSDPVTDKTELYVLQALSGG
jgi:molybdopterin synthase sulfur carrier subunit